MKRRPTALLTTAVYVAACIVGLSLLSGVYTQSSAAPVPSSDTLRFALTHDPQSLDPMIDSSGVTQNILHNIFDSLVMADDDLRQTGDLATSWKFVPPSSWDFTLRPNVRFHNGDPVTAGDVKFSFDRIIDPASRSPMKGFISAITSVAIVDARTVRITTAHPSAILPELTKNVMIVPQRVVESMGAQAFGRAPVGSGPYRFVEWVPNDHMTLQANASYWNQAPPIRTLILRPIPEPSTRVAALLTGQVDMITGFPPSFVSALQANPNIKVVNEPASRTAQIILNTNPSDGFAPFQDRRVRQAMNYAIDYDALIRQIMGGLARRNCNPVPPIFFGYDPSIQCYAYNPDRAKQLLAEAGYSNGFEVEFGATSGSVPNDREVAEAIVGMLARVGVRARLETPEFGVWIANYRARKWPMVFHTNGDVVLDADQVFGLFYFSGGRRYYSSPDMDRLVIASRNEFDPAKRLPLVRTVIRRAVRDALWISLFNMPGLWAMNSRLNLKPRGDEWTVMSRATWSR